jgi:tetratricopeptide (TPR) repeat protein
VPTGALPIAALSGTAGVGKTGLAVHWAHRVRSQFPDGQLYLDLRGYDPDQPLAPSDALTHLLYSLSADAADLPPTDDQRAALYRTLLDGRRVLVLLDNAYSADQVRLLLPGTPACFVLVTSRDSLTGLVARHGARRIDLDLLPPPEATTLLRALIGDRVTAEPTAAATLAEHCVHRPLALRVAAEMVASREHLTLAEQVQELADEQRRLDLLNASSDPRTAVRTVLSWSYRHLPADSAQLFRSLGLLPGADLTTYAAAALVDEQPATATRSLTALVAAHLVQPIGPDRYRLHDLLRAYATQLTREHDPAPYRRAALIRLLDHYTAAATTAVDVLLPTEERRPPVPGETTASVPPLPSAPAALSWLDAERPNLTASCRLAIDQGLPEHAIRLARALSRYLDTRGHYQDALTVHGHAHRAALESSDLSAQAEALSNLAATYAGQGRYTEATDHLTTALPLYRQTEDKAGQAGVLSGLGAICAGRGDFSQAATQLEQALAIHADLDEPAGQARALSNLGGVYSAQGRYTEARARLEESQQLFHRIGDRVAEARVLANLGGVDSQQGQHRPAVDRYQQARQLFHETGDRIGEAHSLTGLADLELSAGQPELASTLHQQALQLFHDIGDQAGQTRTLNALAKSRHAARDYSAAIRHHTEAQALASQIGDRYELARAHHGLADAHLATDQPDRARRHLQTAIGLYHDLGVPELDHARTLLASLNQTDNESGDGGARNPPTN